MIKAQHYKPPGCGLETELFADMIVDPVLMSRRHKMVAYESFLIIPMV